MLKQLGVALFYAALSWLTLKYLSPDGVITTFYLPSGLALAALLIGGKRYLCGIFFGVFWGGLLSGFTLLMSAVMAVGSTLGVYCGFWLVTHQGRFNISLSSISDYLRLIILGAFVPVIVSATIGVTTLLIAGVVTVETYVTSLLRWWMGDTLGIILLTPLILTWWTARKAQFDTKWLTEALLILGLVILAGQVIFLGWFHESLSLVAHGYWMFLFSVWVATRLGTKGTTLLLVIVAAQGLLSAHGRIGYFAHDLDNGEAEIFWSFMLVYALVSTSLATYLAERKQEVLKAAALIHRNQVMMDNALEGIHVLDDRGNLIEANRSFYRLLGYSKEEAQHFNVVDWDTKMTPDGINAAIKQLLDGRAVFETLHRHKDGSVIDVEVSVVGVELDGQRCFYCSSRNVSESKAAADKIIHLAFYDPLTDLPNRLLLRDRLTPALASSHRNARHGALLFIDLDNFKTLNDTLGHDMGDLLLQQVAGRLLACVREEDTVARFGGDEFVVMLEDLNEFINEALMQVEVIGNKILAVFSQSYQLVAHNYYCTPSIGVTLFKGQKQSIDELLKQADIAMYQAKASGRNGLCFFDPQMQANIVARAAMEESLRHALKEGEFRLYYQLQSTHSGEVVGAEVLIRWQHPENGLVSPIVFIPLAEEIGMILPIGLWVLETACAQIKKWEDSAHTQHLQLAVNISARQFYQTDFVAQVCQVLKSTAIKPERLKLELTESVVLDDINDTIVKMHELKEIGVHFSMDDFGTGYSSLSYLTQLPLDQIKIDQSFVRNIGVKPNDATIVQTIIGMAVNLGLDVIAEGVETEAQRAFLELHGCPLCQGYLFGKPVPLEEFEPLLKRR